MLELRVRSAGTVRSSTNEILLDDAGRHAGLPAQSGLAAEFHIWEGMAHAFPAILVQRLLLNREAHDTHTFCRPEA
jgi:hypothetical protein